jgi:hypothetical protein
MNIKYLPPTFTLDVPVSKDLYPAYFLMTKYITQWEKYGLHLRIGHPLMSSGLVSLKAFLLLLPVHNVQHVNLWVRGRDTISHVCSEFMSQ